MRSPDIPGTVAQLRQTQRTRARSKAIITFCRSLRRDHLFQPFWDAVGGATGVASLMAEFSLRDVKTMCNLLGRTASAQKARPERHASLTELVRLLYEDGPRAGVPRDPRPLRQYYQDIVPACDLEAVREWDEQRRVEWTKFQRVCLFSSHREWYKERFLKDLFAPVGATQGTSFSAGSSLFRDNLAFSEAILSTLIADKEGTSRIPGDFMSVFSMPLLRRLFRRRKNRDETRNKARDKFLSLVVHCIRVHTLQLAGQVDEARDELVQFALQRWSIARDRDAPADVATQQQTELCLGELIELLPRRSRQLSTLRDIFDELLLKRKPHVDSYQLLRLILRHARGYEFDIDDGSPSTLSRLRDLKEEGNLWPMGLFQYLDTEDAIGLFERLSDLDVTGSFLDPEGNMSRTVLKQGRTPESSGVGDAEIVRCLLYSKSEWRPDDQAWRDRARSLIRERRKKSEEGREWQQRVFWATSALNLCVAAGDMEMLDDTILWARRFNNQPLVVRDLYNASTLGTTEIRDLLSAVPDIDKDGELVAPIEQVAPAVAKAVEASGRILVHLVETISMSLSQPQSHDYYWQTALYLPQPVVDRRLEKKNAAAFEALFRSAAAGSKYPSSGAVETVWKPTIDALVEAEALLAPSPRLYVQGTGMHVFRGLLVRASGEARADLASFLIRRMKARLGPEGLRLRMQDVVELVTGVADSDQPWRAIPFIRDIILDGEGADSVWHRKLLSFRFLSSLPYKAASDLLYAMADAIVEKMREQNSQPREVAGDDGKAIASPPAVKVTTIKMMAQLLQENRIIGASAACDMLLGLLAEARHVDVLVAIAASLLTILMEPTYSPGVKSRVLNALEESLAPVLAQLSQRRPLSEADWAAVESGDARLPDVADEKPLIWLLYGQEFDSKAMSQETRARFSELLVRVPAQSAVENARWNRLFLSRNGFALDDGERLPESPACLDVVPLLLYEFAGYVPAEVLAAMRDMALVNLEPSPGIARITAAVKADRDLVNSNAGRHWLAQFDNPGTKALERFGIMVAARLLQRAPGELAPGREDGGGVTVGMLVEAILAVAERVISCGMSGTLEELVRCLCVERFESREKWMAWRENCVPVLRRLSERADGLREARKRVPGGGVLPSSFKLRLGMLPIPYSEPPKEAAAEGEVEAFVAEVAGLLGWLAARRVPYHEEFAQLKKEVRQKLDSREYARVALRLGRLGGDRMAVDGEDGEELELADYLRLEIAGSLLAEAGNAVGEGILPEVKLMVREWVASDDELVRLTGLSLEKSLASPSAR